jgi:S-adenosylmethionine hydrolase
MKGVVLSLCPDATVVDVAHNVPPQDLVSAAYLLRDVVPTFPAGTIHVVVVDPGVGTKRRGVVLEAGPAAKGQYFVGPDNGVFADYVPGGRMHLISDPKLMRSTVSQVFHGRDVFSPAAAHLASGVRLEAFGPRVEDPLILDLPRVRRETGSTLGEVLYADKFGNIVTNIEAGHLPEAGDEGLRVEIGWARIDRLCRTYAEVRVGEMLALVGSSGRLEIAVREGSAAERLQLMDLVRTPVKVSARRPSMFGD